MTNINDFGTILTVFYTQDKSLDNESVYRRGSAFLLQYKGELFIVTAKHCIEKGNENNITFVNPASSKDNKFAYPIKNHFYFNDATCDIDIAIFKIDDDIFYSNILYYSQNILSPEQISEKILNTPKIQSIIKRYIRKSKNNPNYNKNKLTSKLCHIIMGTKLFINYKEYLLDKNVKEKIKNSNTSLVECTPLKLVDSDFIFSENKSFYALGYPGANVSFKYMNGEQNKIILNKYNIKFINKNSSNINFNYEQTIDFNGISGSPIICNGFVVGMITDIQEKDKIFGAYSFNMIKRCLDEYLKTEKTNFTLEKVVNKYLESKFSM